MFVVSKRTAKLIACLTMLMLLFTLSGCLTKAIEGDKQGKVEEVEPDVLTEEVVDLSDVTEEPATTDEEQVTTGDDPEAAPAEKVKVTLYFSDKTGQKLVAETREITKVEGLARATIEELAKGPTNSELKATLPKGTKLLDINIKPDGLAIVDLSTELKDKHTGGSTAELLTVYSIVNTMADFPTVKEVQILIGSQKVESLAGHVELLEPLKPDQSLVK